MEKSLKPKIAAEQVHDTFRKTAAQFEVLARDTETSNARSCREERYSNARDL